MSDERRNFVGHLRHKYKKNQRLSVLQSPKIERALSWNEDQCAEAVRRTSDVRLNSRAGRAMTMDMSPTRDEPEMSPKFNLEDTVFEEDEETVRTEEDPLLRHMSSKSANQNANSKSANQNADNKHVTFHTEEGVDKTGGTISSTPKASKPPGDRSAGTPKIQSTQSEIHHGLLFRQDALNESDGNVELKDLSPKPNQSSVRKSSL